MFQSLQKILILFLFLFVLANCQLGSSQPGVLGQVASRPLSLQEPELKTCVFDPGYSLVHFPMFHTSPNIEDNTPGTYSDLTVKSQFQLLHTLLDYNRSLRGFLTVFDEVITEDGYDLNYLSELERGLVSSDQVTRLDGRIFNLTERYQTARNLFGGGFPSYYEHLNELQKQFLYDTGASLALYFVREIAQLYKVISPQKFNVVKNSIIGINENSDQYRYQVFTVRELELRIQIQQFYQRNPTYRGLVFIAYGANHDFSDEFAGYPFQSGHPFCLNWTQSSSPHLLP